jgi:drug/metabolite transporter (DMT)-like permease
LLGEGCQAPGIPPSYLRYLQLDQTVSILFSTPFFVTLLSGFVLGEWAGWRRWTAIAIGFSGVLLIARPGMGGMHPAALLCVAGAICYSVSNISTRVLSRTDSTETTLFYSNFVGSVAVLPALPFVWKTPHGAAGDRAHDPDRRVRQLGTLPSDRRSPARVGFGAGAVHL